MISLSNATPPAMDSADARKAIDAAEAAGSLWKMPAEERNKLFAAGYPGLLPGFGATVRIDSAPAPATLEAAVSPQPPPWPPPNAHKMDPWTAQRMAEEELARGRQTLGADNRTILTLGAQDTPPEQPEAPEQPPVSVADADLPPITLPEGVSADDPIVRGVRQLGVLAEVAPTAVESLVAHVHSVLETEPPDEEEYWRQSDAALAAARQKYGPRFNAFLDAVQRGRRFVEEHEPGLVDVLEHPMVQKDLRVATMLANIGSQGRSLYVRKYGTKPLFRV